MIHDDDVCPVCLKNYESHEVEGENGVKTTIYHHEDNVDHKLQHD